MRVIPIDTQQVRLFGAGTTVEEVAEYVELSDSTRRRSGNQAKAEDGRLIWAVYANIPGDAGERPETVKIKITSKDAPQPGGFGEPLEFERLAVMPYVDQASGRIAFSWRADGVKVAAGRGRPAPTPGAGQ